MKRVGRGSMRLALSGGGIDGALQGQLGRQVMSMWLEGTVSGRRVGRVKCKFACLPTIWFKSQPATLQANISISSSFQFLYSDIVKRRQTLSLRQIVTHATTASLFPSLPVSMDLQRPPTRAEDHSTKKTHTRYLREDDQ